MPDEPAQAPPAKRAQEHRVEEITAAALRALSGEPGLRFRGGRLHRGRVPLPMGAPHLQPEPDAETLQSLRGLIDGVAMRLRCNDRALHLRLCPKAPMQRLIFEMLEQHRVESLAGEAMPGMRSNLAARFADWSRRFHHGGLADSAAGLLLYTVAQISRAQVVGSLIPAETEGMMEAPRADLSTLIGEDLAGLKRQRHSQQAYGMHAIAIAREVAGLIHVADEQAREQDETDTAPSGAGSFALWMDFDDDLDGGAERAADGQRESEVQDYRVWTRAYDEQVTAPSLARAAELSELRERLDRLVLAQGMNVARLARALRAMLARPQAGDWADGQEEGLIDGRRLARLVSAPQDHRVFRWPRQQPIADCQVTFLVDCSGSMKAHVSALAVLIDLFGRAFDMAGIAFELLGFTTRAWNGGRAQIDWERAGRPDEPGRVAEARHIVFKCAGQRWRTARPAVAALLKPDLYREGLDGEAIEWAADRMLGRASARRILVVLSDGSPMESATRRANDNDVLDAHLAQVVARLESQRRIELRALGVGLDLSRWYRHGLPIELARGLGNDTFYSVAALIGGYPVR